MKRGEAGMDTAAMLARAVQLGRDIEDILGDVSLQRLSREAWAEHARVLAGTDDLDALRARIEALPHLHRLVGGVAMHWARTGQDRPVREGVLDDGDSHPAAYAERIVAGITSEQASAVVALLAAELMPASAWGFLGHHEQIPRMIQPREEELAVLDHALQHELRVRDLSWTAAGASLEASGCSVALTAESARAPASAIAQAARSGVRDRLLAKAA